MMDKLTTCDFAGINSLFGWTNNCPHTDISGLNSTEVAYEPQLASSKCNDADLVVYKTVSDFGRRIDNVIPVIDRHQRMRAIVPVRDPRGIYASWKNRPWDSDGVDLLLGICDDHKANLRQKH